MEKEPKTKSGKITDKIKSAVGLPILLTMDDQMLKDFCWDAVNVKCIAFKKDKEGKVLRAYPPHIPDKEIGDWTIISFR